MKGKKYIGLIILCITFLLCLNQSSNANAITNNAYKNPHKVDYVFEPNSVNQSINLIDNFLSPELYFNPSYNQTQYIKDFKIHFYGTAPVSKKDRFKFNILFKTYLDAPQTFYLSSPFCPFGINGFVVDTCSIQALSETISINNFMQTPIPSSGSVQLWEYGGEQDSTTYYILHIEGYYNSDQVVNVSSIQFTRPFYSISNLAQNSFFTANLRFAIGTITFYSEDIDPQEEAAEKELEDRDNLETQSSTTDNQANNEGQNAENTGTTLFSAFSQLFNALTNVSGNNCTLPQITVYSLDLGRINLCNNTIPPQISALVSIGMVFIIVPLGIHLVKKMLSLYKEITG